VSSGSARRGRRDNGLDAAEYAAAGDVDPRVGEHLLDVLAVQGIAAYLQPAVDLNPITRSTTMPSRPTDRLYVDRAHLSTAREYLASLTSPASSGAPAPAEDGGEPVRDEAVDDVWAQIVAGYDAEIDTTAAPWPEAENVAGPPPPPAAPPAPPAPRAAASAEDPPSLLTGLDTFGADLPDEPTDDEGYTPPPPPPLPRISKYAVLGVLGIIAGFVLFIRPTLVPIDPDVSMLIGFSAILAGFVTLVWRLRPGDDDDDYDPDDGAKV
jgi:hypothetical protein